MCPTHPLKCTIAYRWLPLTEAMSLILPIFILPLVIFTSHISIFYARKILKNRWRANVLSF